MKIRGMDWMEWLHRVRKESQRQRKSSRRTLAKHLKTLEGKTILTGKGPSDIPGAIKRKAKSR